MWWGILVLTTAPFLLKDTFKSQPHQVGHNQCFFFCLGWGGPMDHISSAKMRSFVAYITYVNSACLLPFAHIWVYSVEVTVPDTGHLCVYRDLGLNKTASEETVLSEATFLGTLPNVSGKKHLSQTITVNCRTTTRNHRLSCERISKALPLERKADSRPHRVWTKNRLW